MIIELRTYSLHPGAMDTFWKQYERGGQELLEPMRPHMLGYFFTEFGPLNRVVHAWRFESFEERSAKRGEMAANPAWREHLSRIRPLIDHQKTMIMLPSPLEGLRGGWAGG